jgi:hypothetical protein
MPKPPRAVTPSQPHDALFRWTFSQRAHAVGLLRTFARQAFCASQPESDVRARCRSHVFDKPVEWANWCYNELAE